MNEVGRLQQLVQIPTVSRLEVEDTDWTHFDTFIATLEKLFPLVHSTLEREIVAGHSLLFHWRGRSEAEPAVLMAHYDVVAATDEGWQHPPFGAELVGDGDDQVIWGRGTLDDKGSLVAILEAVESHLASGHQPFHDLYLSFGHDEETHGTGATEISALFASRGIRPAFVLDEGGAIVSGAFPGVDAPVAVFGVSEKGTTVIRLTVEQSGGHASTPPKVTSTTRLARAIVKLGRKQFRRGFNPAVIGMFEALGPHATGPVGFAFRNVRFTRPALLALFSRMTDETRAMTGTSLAVTMLSAGLAANALAEKATATVNIRVAVGSTVAEAVEHVRKAINDPLVAITIVDASEPSPISPSSGMAWDILATSLERTHPGTVVTPYVQNGATDSRKFTGLTDNVYRFTPFEMSKDERDTLHAVDERMHVATYLRGIEFYRALVGAL